MKSEGRSAFAARRLGSGGSAALEIAADGPEAVSGEGQFDEGAVQPEIEEMPLPAVAREDQVGRSQDLDGLGDRKPGRARPQSVDSRFEAGRGGGRDRAAQLGPLRPGDLRDQGVGGEDVGEGGHPLRPFGAGRGGFPGDFEQDAFGRPEDFAGGRAAIQRSGQDGIGQGVAVERNELRSKFIFGPRLGWGQDYCRQELIGPVVP